MLLLLLLLTISTTSGRKISGGLWKSTNGQQIYFDIMKGLVLDGYYGEETDNKTTITYPLVGLISSPTTPAAGSMISFCVVWQNGLKDSNCVSSWDGVINTTTVVTSWSKSCFENNGPWNPGDTGNTVFYKKQ